MGWSGVSWRGIGNAVGAGMGWERDGMGTGWRGMGMGRDGRDGMGWDWMGLGELGVHSGVVMRSGIGVSSGNDLRSISQML